MNAKSRHHEREREREYTWQRQAAFIHELAVFEKPEHTCELRDLGHKAGVESELEVVVVSESDDFDAWSWWALDWGTRKRSSRRRRPEFATTATVWGSDERIEAEFLLLDFKVIFLLDPPIVQFFLLCLRDFCMLVVWQPLSTSFKLHK